MRQEMMGFWDAVASAGPYANNLHLAPDKYTPTPHHSIFAGRMLFLMPNHSVKALKACLDPSTTRIFPIQSIFRLDFKQRIRTFSFHDSFASAVFSVYGANLILVTGVTCSLSRM